MPHDSPSVRRIPLPATDAPQFACAWTRDGPDSASVRPVGELDHGNLAQFRATLGEAQAGAEIVRVDMRELTFIDCAGLGAIVEARNDARRRGGSLTLVRGSGQVHRILELIGLVEEVVPAEVEPVRSIGVGPTDATASAGPVRLQFAASPVPFRGVG